MSDNRKYYYLKLKENYFDDDSIVLLESMQDGVLYSNILLKLYLKSLKHGGRLQSGNVKKCAVGKHPKSEKLGSTGQAACCARIHSRYFTGGSPSGLRV